MKVESGDVILSAYGIGSCVAIIFYEPREKIGGLAHILIPWGKENSTKNPKGAIKELLRQFSARGINGDRIIAKIVGGATFFGEFGHSSIGKRNVIETRNELERLAIPIVAEDVFGDWGRTIFFNLNNGQVIVKSYRHGDKII